MIRVLIADDHEFVRKGLRNFLEGECGINVVAEASNCLEVIDVLRENYVDVAVIDISMPGGSGLDVLQQIKKYRPNLPVLFLTMHSENRFAVRALKSGAAGYITKESAPKELVKAIRKVVRGGTYVSEHLAEMLAYGLHSKDAKPIHETLSNREYQIMLLIAKGESIKGIACGLSISAGTVYTHRERILEKMRMRTNVEIAHYAVLNGLVD